MSRFLSLAEAVEATLGDGDTVAMEGFTHLIPFAAGHEVIRQRRRHLTLIRMTPDIIYDQLIGMGCADRLVFSWVLPSWTLGAIACVPGGAHPSYAHGYYKRDNAYYKAWDAISRDRDDFLPG